MSDRITSSKIVGGCEVAGRSLAVVRHTWRDATGRSFDVEDTATGEILTMDESFDSYPTSEQLSALVE